MNLYFLNKGSISCCAILFFGYHGGRFFLFASFCSTIRLRLLLFPIGSIHLTLPPGDHLLLKTFLLVLLYALACYPLIYFVLPEIIIRKWLKATAHFLLLCSFLYIATYFLFWNVFSFIDSSSGTSKTNYSTARFWPPSTLA